MTYAALALTLILLFREWHWRSVTRELTEERDGLGKQAKFWREYFAREIRHLDEQDVKQ